MHSRPAFAVVDQQRLARAFLALGDDDAPYADQRSIMRAVAAFAAAVTLALAAPLIWSAPAPTAGAKLGEQPAATLGSSKALLTADDEDDGAV
jgi:hypothetical protein